MSLSYLHPGDLSYEEIFVVLLMGGVVLLVGTVALVVFVVLILKGIDGPKK